jgi:acetolactate synthase-1/2/3 large subunit
MLGMHGTAYANFSVSECDLLIAIGARFDDRVTGKLDEFAVNAQIIHIDIDPAEIGKNRTPQLSLIGDVKKILGELIKITKTSNITTPDQTFAWRERIKKWQDVYPLIIPKSGTKISPQEILYTLNQLKPEAFFTTDVGQHQMWSAQFLKCQIRKWSSSAGLGTMGYGIPAAIGNQVAFPKQSVICITGDASIQMNIQELGTIAQYQLPVKIILLNNNWQGMVRQWQQSFYGERYSQSSMEEGSPNFVMLAESYGIKAAKLGKTADFESKLKELLESTKYQLNLNLAPSPTEKLMTEPVIATTMGLNSPTTQSLTSMALESVPMPAPSTSSTLKEFNLESHNNSKEQYELDSYKYSTLNNLDDLQTPNAIYKLFKVEYL